ncbi:MAG: hypothetical protein RL499_972 [Actinomycetota bacterium]|jgi:hypothetical protein
MSSRRILHIGETGGTSIQWMLRRLRARLEGDDLEALPTLLSHAESRTPWRAEHEETSTFAVVFRDPDRRYVSGFMSRLRQGRPEAAQGRRLWTPAEAAAFSWFREPNALFEALGSDDDAEQSAAHFAMNAIAHLRRDHTWYLGSAEEFLTVAHRFWCVVPLTELSQNLDDLLPDSSDRVRDDARRILERRHVAVSPAPTLSARSREMLRQHRSEEYALYDALVAEHARREAR